MRPARLPTDQPGAAATAGAARGDSRRLRVGKTTGGGYLGGDAATWGSDSGVAAFPLGLCAQAVRDGSADPTCGLRRSGPARSLSPHRHPARRPQRAWLMRCRSRCVQWPRKASA
eukprot:scaffold735_cov376-Prasinococcus_capsulatus_cf.AAC.29